MKIVNAAILGQGRSGRDIHGLCLSKKPDKYKIVAVADPLEDRCERAAKEYGCQTCSDYRELLGRKDIDIIINATPSYLHVPISLDLIEKGFNVVCEKPLARTAGEVDMLIDAHKRSGKLFTIFQQSRYAPYFQQIRKITDSGVLGRLIQISINSSGFSRRWDWQCLQENNGGSLLNSGPHPVDQALLFFGTDIMPDVKCIMDRVNTFGDAEDYVKLILTGPNRPVIDIEISSCSAYNSYAFNIQGKNGSLAGTTEHVEWKYFKPEEAPAQHLIREPLRKEDGTPAYCGETLKWYNESWDVPESEKDHFGTMSNSYYDMLYECLTEGKQPLIAPEQVRAQIAIMEECHRQNPLSRIS